MYASQQSHLIIVWQKLCYIFMASQDVSNSSALYVFKLSGLSFQENKSLSVPFSVSIKHGGISSNILSNFVGRMENVLKTTRVEIETQRYCRLNQFFPRDKHVLHFFVRDGSFSSEPSLNFPGTLLQDGSGMCDMAEVVNDKLWGFQRNSLQSVGHVAGRQCCPTTEKNSHLCLWGCPDGSREHFMVFLFFPLQNRKGHFTRAH